MSSCAHNRDVYKLNGFVQILLETWELETYGKIFTKFSIYCCFTLKNILIISNPIYISQFPPMGRTTGCLPFLHSLVIDYLPLNILFNVLSQISRFHSTCPSKPYCRDLACAHQQIGKNYDWYLTTQLLPLPSVDGGCVVCYRIIVLSCPLLISPLSSAW
jgi:hypothetical protein